MHTQPSVYLIGLGCDKEASAVMLGAEFVVELVFDFGEVRVGLAGDDDRLALVLGSVYFDEVLERVVVDVIWQTSRTTRSARILPQERVGTANELWYWGTHDDIRRLHSGTDSLSKFSPYFIASSDPSSPSCRRECTDGRYAADSERYVRKPGQSGCC